MTQRCTILFVVAIACFLCRGAQTAESEKAPAAEQFHTAYNILQRADELRDKQQSGAAVRLYMEALDNYTRLTKEFPDWEPSVVRFRITYCDNQLESLLKRIEDEKAGGGKQPGQKEEQGASDLEIIKSTARLLLKDGQTAKARTLLLDGLNLDPDDRVIRLLSGIAQCQAGEYEDAMYVLSQLVEENRSDPVAHVLLGAAYFGLGQFKDATEEMKAALSFDPGLHEAHYNLARVMLALTPPDRDAALRHYERAIELGGAPDEEFGSLLAKE